MNISLEEYGEFAKKLNLSSHKDFNGSFTYVDKDTGDVIHPYLLGKLYRLVKQEKIQILEKEIDSLEYDIIKEKHKLKELPLVVKDCIQKERCYIDSLKNEIIKYSEENISEKELKQRASKRLESLIKKEIKNV